jgi:hypothetical protein
MVNKSVSIIKWSLFQSAFDESQILRNKNMITNEISRDLNVYFISTPENLANWI